MSVIVVQRPRLTGALLGHKLSHHTQEERTGRGLILAIPSAHKCHV